MDYDPDVIASLNNAFGYAARLNEAIDLGSINDLVDEPDNVNHPKHYRTYIEGLETIDMIYAVLGPERFEGYCRGNALKYLARADDKGHTVEDLEKAIVYIKWEIETRKSHK